MTDGNNGTVIVGVNATRAQSGIIISQVAGKSLRITWKGQILISDNVGVSTRITASEQAGAQRRLTGASCSSLHPDPRPAQ